MILLSKPTKQTSFDICFCFAVFLQINRNKQKPLLLFLCILFEVSQNRQFRSSIARILDSRKVVF